MNLSAGSTESAREAGRILLALRCGAVDELRPRARRQGTHLDGMMAVEAERLELLDSILTEVRRSLAGGQSYLDHDNVEVCVRLLEHLAGSTGPSATAPETVAAH